MILTMDQDVRARAMRAQTVGRKMLNTTLRPLVRMFSRNSKMNVVLTGGTPRTDGRTTWLRIPIELGDDTPHNKELCGRRDPETSIQMCEACHVRDESVWTIFHEAAHCIFGSFEKISDYDLQQIIEEAIRLEAQGKAESSRAAKLKARFDTHSKTISTYIGAANLVSPFLPMLVNVMEDVYVNAAMIEARPGTALMARAHLVDAFTNGNKREDGTVFRWNEADLNAQATIGILCKGSKMDYRSWLDPKVVEALADPTITALTERIVGCGTAAQRYRLAIQTLEALRALGFLLSPDDPEDDPEPGEPDPEGEGEPGEGGTGQSKENEDDHSEDSDDEEGEGTGNGSGGDSDEEDDEESSDGSGGSPESTGKDTEPEDGNDDSGGGADDDTFGDEGDTDGHHASMEPPKFGDPTEAEELFRTFSGHDREDEDGEPELTPDEEDERDAVEVAVQQGEHFDQPSDHLTGLKVITHREGGAAFRQGDGSVEDAPMSVLGPALLKARIIFAQNKKGKMERNLESGSRLDKRSLARRFAMGDPRVFSKKTLPGKRDYFVCIGLDVSGSTQRPGLIRDIKMAAGAQAEVLAKLGIKFAVYGHSGDGGVVIHEVKGPNEPWGAAQRQALGRLGPYSANLDGHTLEFYRKVLDQQSATDRIILYYTDGAMPLENYEEELAVLQKEIDICKRRGYTLLGVGVRTSSPEAHGLETVRLDGPEDVGKVIQALGRHLT